MPEPLKEWEQENLSLYNALESSGISQSRQRGGRSSRLPREERRRILKLQEEQARILRQQLGSMGTQRAGTTAALGQQQQLPPPPQLQEKPSGDIADENILMRGLELLGRPGQAAPSAVSYWLQGRNPLEGAWAGLQGRGDWWEKGVLSKKPLPGFPKGIGEGIPDTFPFRGGIHVPGGKLETPLGTVTDRGLMGLGLDIVTDPLTYLGKGIPVGQLPRAVSKGLKVLPTAKNLIRKNIENATEIVPVIENLVEKQSTLKGKIGQSLGGIPKLGGALRHLSPVAFPKKGVTTAQDHIKIAMLAENSQTINLPNFVSGQLAELRSRKGQQLLGEITPEGRIMLTDGQQVAWSDALSFPEYRHLLTPNQELYAKKVSEIFEGMYEAAIQADVQNIEPYILRKSGGVEERFIPRVTKTEGTELLETGSDLMEPTGSQGTRQGHWQKGRKYESGEQAIEAGDSLLSPDTVVEIRLMEQAKSILGRNFEKVIEPYAKKTKFPEIKETINAIKETEDNIDLLGTAFLYTKRIGAGEKIHPRTLKKLREQGIPGGYEDLSSEIENLTQEVIKLRLAPLEKVKEILTRSRKEITEALGIEPARAKDFIKDFVSGLEEMRLLDASSPPSLLQPSLTRRPAAPAREMFRSKIDFPGPLSASISETKKILIGMGKKYKSLAKAKPKDVDRILRQLDKKLGIEISYKELSKPLKKKVGELKNKIQALKIEEKSAKGKLSKTLERLQAAPEGKVEVKGLLRGKEVTIFKGLWFEPENAKILTEYFQQEGAKGRGIIRPFKDVSEMSRTVTTNLDFAAPTLQGLPLLIRYPEQWFRAVAQSFLTLLDPLQRQRFLASKQDVINSFPGLAISSRSGEFTAGMRLGTDVQRGALLPRVVAWAGRKIPKLDEEKSLWALEGTMGRFAEAFNAFGDAGRIYAAEALTPLAQKTGKARELAEFLNKMTGAYATPGLSVRQRELEAGMLLFASRYTRSSMALVFDIFGGGVGARQAQKTLGLMLTSGVAMYIKFANFIDQEPQLDPSKGRFMSVQLGTDVVGVGSIWIAMARLLAKSVVEPENIVDISDPGSGHLVRFWRARGSPSGTAALDMFVFKESYIGEPLDTPIQWSKYLGSKLIPFAVESHLLQNPKAYGWSILPEFLGAKVLPQGYVERRGALAKKEFGVSYDELTPYQQVELEQMSELKEFPAPAGERGKKLRRSATAFESRGHDLAQMAMRTEAGILTKEEFREKEGDIAQQLGVRLRDIEEEFPRKGKEKKLYGKEAARTYYLSLLRTEFVWEEAKFEEAEQYFASLPREFQDYIEDKQKASYGRLTPLAEKYMMELWEARRTLQEYWGLRNEALEELGIKDEWDRMSSGEQEEFVTSDIRYKMASRVWARQRKILKRRNPKVRKALIEWYGHRR